MEWLQKILSNAVYGEDGKLDLEATMKKVNEEAPKHIVPKEQYNGKVKELDTASKTIGDLKKNNADNEELQETIKTHEETIKQMKLDHENEIKGMRIDSAIGKILTDHKAKHADLLAGKFDRSKLSISDDGTVLGLEEQMKSLKESYKDLFTQTVIGQTPLNPDGVSSGTATFDALVKNADHMTAEEVAAQFTAMAEKQ